MYGTVKAEMVCTQVRSSSYVFLSYGDNVKIYMQMMDLESCKKVKKTLKKLDLNVVSFYETVFRTNS